MPNPRKTAATHKVQGTYRKDRHGAKTVALTAIDPTPPPHLPKSHHTAWRELCEAGQDYIAASDHLAVEIACGLLVKARAGEAKATELAQLAALFNRMGLTPASRRSLDKLGDAPGLPDNPFEGF